MTAEERLREATAEYAAAEAAYESAAMLGDAAKLAEADERLRKADLAYGQSLAAVVAEAEPSPDRPLANRAAAPSFEEMLRSPLIQPDPDSEVLSRVVVYAASVNQTAALPVVPTAAPTPRAALSSESRKVVFENLLHDTDRVCVG